MTRQRWTAWFATGPVFVIFGAYAGALAIAASTEILGRLRGLNPVSGSELLAVPVLFGPYLIPIPGLVAATMLVLDGPERRPARERRLLVLAVVLALVLFAVAVSPLGWAAVRFAD